jgi:Tat protein secretion system quality control protein TatD with DNase activity
MFIDSHAHLDVPNYDADRAEVIARACEAGIELLLEVARAVPLERLLSETDCPFLAPAPHRGKRNEPAFVGETAKKLAELQGVSVAELAAATSGNFRRLFRLPTATSAV